MITFRQALINAEKINKALVDSISEADAINIKKALVVSKYIVREGSKFFSYGIFGTTVCYGSTSVDRAVELVYNHFLEVKPSILVKLIN